MIKFTEDGHKYTSTDGSDIKWKSVTGLLHNFTQPFDADMQAAKSNKNKKSKWYSLGTDEIKKEWKATNTYSLELGKWYHNLMEATTLSHNSIVVDNVELEIIRPVYINGEKYAPEQRLENNKKYPERFTYLKSAGICGQSDNVEVVNHFLNVSDFKTNKEIKLQSYKKWDGTYQMMQPPFGHLMDCNYVTYCFQLSLYMYMILKHNPQLKPGKITLNHILFEEQARDKFDNPIYRTDENGNFFVKDTVDYNVPYMKAECQTLINWLQNNKK